jgi:hypothetical protein
MYFGYFKSEFDWMKVLRLFDLSDAWIDIDRMILQNNSKFFHLIRMLSCLSHNQRKFMIGYFFLGEPRYLPCS